MSFHTCSDSLSLISWLDLFLSSLSVALVLPPKSFWIKYEAFLQLLLCVASVPQLVYCQVLLLCHSWFFWWQPWFFDRSWSDFYRKMRVCYFDIRWNQWRWPIQEFLKSFSSSVSLFLNFSEWLAFVLDQSPRFTISPYQFLLSVIWLFHISISCSIFLCYY